jgi:beta-glucosidase
MYYPSSPLRELQKLAAHAQVKFASGENREAAAKLAAASDVAVVFVTQWSGESLDNPLTLPDGQDALVAAVAKANPRTVVVLETGGAVFMPWLASVSGVLQAWYPGTSGGEAIAKLLLGTVNPSGRLPITYPADESQFARAVLVEETQGKKSGDVHYNEGATVGYKWFDAKKLQPLFPFGFGLSYTSFKYGNLQARLDGQDLVVKFEVRNAGERDGKDVPQVYVSSSASGWEAPKRLGAWRKVELKGGASTTVELRVDPRLLGVFDAGDNSWHIAAGTCQILLGSSAAEIALRTSVQLPARQMPAGYRP